MSLLPISLQLTQKPPKGVVFDKNRGSIVIKNEICNNANGHEYKYKFCRRIYNNLSYDGITVTQVEKWSRDNSYHRDDGIPAYIEKSGYIENDKIIWTSTNVKFYINGELQKNEKDIY